MTLIGLNLTLDIGYVSCVQAVLPFVDPSVEHEQKAAYVRCPQELLCTMSPTCSRTMCDIYRQHRGKSQSVGRRRVVAAEAILLKPGPLLLYLFVYQPYQFIILGVQNGNPTCLLQNQRVAI